jgi:hypothetical protein
VPTLAEGDDQWLLAWLGKLIWSQDSGIQWTNVRTCKRNIRSYCCMVETMGGEATDTVAGTTQANARQTKMLIRIQAHQDGLKKMTAYIDIASHHTNQLGSFLQYLDLFSI